jgi:hypothetical protein
VTSRYVGVREADPGGRTGAVHALASEARGLETTTACGRHTSAGRGTGQPWDAVRGDDRCTRCADAVRSARVADVRPSPRLPGMEWWRF